MSLLAFGGCHQKKKKKENKLEKKTQATIFDELSYLHTHVADAPEGRGQGGGAPTGGGGGPWSVSWPLLKTRSWAAIVARHVIRNVMRFCGSFVHCGKRTMFHFRADAMSLPMSQPMSMSWHLSSRYIPYLLTIQLVVEGVQRSCQYSRLWTDLRGHHHALRLHGNRWGIIAMPNGTKRAQAVANS